MIESRPSDGSNIYEPLPPECLERHPSARTDLEAFDAVRTAWPLSKEVRDVLLGGRMRALVRSLLCVDSAADHPCLFNEQYIVKPSRSAAGGSFGWHRDSDSLIKVTGENATPYLSVWVAIDDMTSDNGCLVVRCKDALGDSADGSVQDIPLEVAAGTAVVMSSMLEHCSGPNVTRFSRRAWMPQFSARPITWRREEGGEGEERGEIDVPVSLCLHL